jgi:hypothetical protein
MMSIASRVAGLMLALSGAATAFGQTRGDTAQANAIARAADFGFERVANNGGAATGTSLGSGPTDWACTRHTVTGLVWEIKLATPGALRSAGSTYSWLSGVAASNGGQAGVADGGSCSGSVCDTQAYVAAVNALALCGFTDWRLPTRHELAFIVREGAVGSGSATVNPAFFPNTRPADYWTGTNFAGNPELAWLVSFNAGATVYDKKSAPKHVMLVRGAP